VLVRNPISNAIVLGLLGVWAFYSGMSNYLKQPEPWPGGVTLGVMAIICAAQVLTGSSRIETMCSWRILLTFFGLYMTMRLVTEGKGSIEFAILKGVAVMVVVYVYSKFWRRSYVESWGLDNSKEVEYPAPNPGPQADS
jgi:hypothetical protein